MSLGSNNGRHRYSTRQVTQNTNYSPNFQTKNSGPNPILIVGIILGILSLIALLK